MTLLGETGTYNPVGAVCAAGTTSQFQYANSATSRQSYSTSYVMLKKITTKGLRGTIKANWMIVANSGGTGYSRLYRNGEAVGSEFSTTAGQECNVDQAIEPGDIFEVWARISNGSYPVEINWLRLYTTENPTLATIQS